MENVCKFLGQQECIAVCRESFTDVMDTQYDALQRIFALDSQDLINEELDRFIKEFINHFAESVVYPDNPETDENSDLDEPPRQPNDNFVTPPTSRESTPTQNVPVGLSRSFILQTAKAQFDQYLQQNPNWLRETYQAYAQPLFPNFQEFKQHLYSSFQLRLGNIWDIFLKYNEPSQLIDEINKGIPDFIDHYVNDMKTAQANQNSTLISDTGSYPSIHSDTGNKEHAKENYGELHTADYVRNERLVEGTMKNRQELRKQKVKKLRAENEQNPFDDGGPGSSNAGQNDNMSSDEEVSMKKPDLVSKTPVDTEQDAIGVLLKNQGPAKDKKSKKLKTNRTSQAKSLELMQAYRAANRDILRTYSGFDELNENQQEKVLDEYQQLTYENSETKSKTKSKTKRTPLRNNPLLRTQIQNLIEELSRSTDSDFENGDDM